MSSPSHSSTRPFIFPTPRPAAKMRPPARRWVNNSIFGKWEGRFSGNSATLTITRRKSNQFWGFLEVMSSQGKTRVQIYGTLPRQNWLTTRETRVLSQPRAGAWSLGVNAGMFVQGGRTITGHGIDARGSSYQWTFSRPRAERKVRLNRGNASALDAIKASNRTRKLRAEKMAEQQFLAAIKAAAKRQKGDGLHHFGNR